MKSITKLKDDARRHEQREEWESAIRAYQQVLAAQDEGESDLELSLYNRIGDLFVRLNRPRDAVQYYEQAADRYAEAGLYNNAIALCNKALRYRADRPELLRKLGQFSASQGFLTDARRYLLEYAEKQFVTGDIASALSALEEFAQVADDVEVRELLGRRLHAHGRVAEALTQLKRALELRSAAGETEAAEALRREIGAMEGVAARPPAGPAATPPDTRGGAAMPSDQRPSPAVPAQPGGSTAATPDTRGAAAAPAAGPARAPAAPPPVIPFVTDAPAPPPAPAAPAAAGRPPSPLDARASAINPANEMDVNLTDPSGRDAETLDTGLVIELPTAPPAEEPGDDRIGGIDGLETTTFEGAVTEPLDGLLADLGVMDDDTEGASVEVPGLERPEVLETDAASGFAPGELIAGSGLEAAAPAAPGGAEGEPAQEDEIRAPAPSEPAFELPELRWPEEPPAAPTAEETSDPGDMDPLERAANALLGSSGWDEIGEADEPLDLPLLSFDDADEVGPAAPEADRPIEPDEFAHADEQGFDLPLLGDLEDSEPLPRAASPVGRGADRDEPAPPDPVVGPRAEDLDARELPAIEEPPELVGPDRFEAPPEAPPTQSADRTSDEGTFAGIDEELSELLGGALDELRPESWSQAGATPSSGGDTPQPSGGDTPPQPIPPDDLYDRDPWAMPPNPPSFRSPAAPPPSRPVEPRDSFTPAWPRPEEQPVPDWASTPPHIEPFADEPEAEAADEATPLGEGRPDDLRDSEIEHAPAGGPEDRHDSAPADRYDPAPVDSYDPALEDLRDRAPEELREPPPEEVGQPTPEGVRAPAREEVREPAPVEREPAPDEGPAPAAETSGVPAPDPARPEPGSDYIDLAALIVDSPADEDTRFVVQERAPTGDEDRDFAELLSQFKQKVSEHVSVEDAAAHYDLGLAFKEMGLVDEAIGEFQVALRAGDMRLKVYEELGHCFLQKEQYNIAEKVLRRALETRFDDELELLGVYYHLGRACEGQGDRAGARDAYERVLGMDIHFADVAARLARL